MPDPRGRAFLLASTWARAADRRFAAGKDAGSVGREARMRADARIEHTAAEEANGR